MVSVSALFAKNLLKLVFLSLCALQLAAAATLPNNGAIKRSQLSYGQRTQRASGCRSHLNQFPYTSAHLFCKIWLNGRHPSQHVVPQRASTVTSSITALTTQTSIAISTSTIPPPTTTVTSTSTQTSTTTVYEDDVSTSTIFQDTTKTVCIADTSPPPSRRARSDRKDINKLPRSYASDVITDACLLFLYGRIDGDTAAAKPSTIVKTVATSTTKTIVSSTTVVGPVSTVVVQAAPIVTTQASTTTQIESYTVQEYDTITHTTTRYFQPVSTNLVRDSGFENYAAGMPPPGANSNSAWRFSGASMAGVGDSAALAKSGTKYAILSTGNNFGGEIYQQIPSTTCTGDGSAGLVEGLQYRFQMDYRYASVSASQCYFYAGISQHDGQRLVEDDSGVVTADYIHVDKTFTSGPVDDGHPTLLAVDVFCYGTGTVYVDNISVELVI